MSIDQVVVGRFAVSDTVLPSSASAIRELIHRGLTVVMVSGDQRPAAQSIADRVGISNIEAEVLPDEKAAIVQRHQQHGTVAMVGDGINDAPALAQADLAIAMGSGTDVAMEVAGITLLRQDLQGVVSTLVLSQRTVTVIRQNLFWAFGYNIVMIPLAVAGKMGPMPAAAAMALSSVSVITNSLRLRRVRL